MEKFLWRALQYIILDVTHVLLVNRLQTLGLALAVLVESAQTKLMHGIDPEHPLAYPTKLS